MKKQKIFHLVTVSKSIPLMKGQIEFLRGKGLDACIISSDGKEIRKFDKDAYRIVNMEREISILKDIKSLVNLIILFLKEKPLIVNSGTPKAGLLGTIAAFITKRPNRIYTVRGLRLETVTGLRYKLLYTMEKIAMMCSTDIIAISDSLKEKIIELGLAKESKIRILGYGSSNGLNVKDFNVTNNKIDINIKEQLVNSFVVGYVGRIVKDKGISELIKSFQKLQELKYNIKLLIVGDFEKADSISDEEIKILKNDSNIVWVNRVDNPVAYFNNMDVFVFPTYREGFGNVSIEAQLLKVPVITTNVTGAKDTVINGETGFIVEKNEVDAIVEKIELLINDENYRKNLGENGKKWIEKYFSNDIIWNDLEQLYINLLQK
ncbi:glycosyltransferase family 4 protein [Staphylococcus nepalensis]|uniref:glycosyltransferase family 4 protein n=1 Tax=Staphylococcus nepalensis TaxID=214473 RepID=UPI001E3216AC|nr:glycosyltransferase family 4 protein [Staphylococcus nepalensis]MCD8892232.1 glycosyltransferase family 4 protein [Staphylococcus nepalensis]